MQGNEVRVPKFMQVKEWNQSITWAIIDEKITRCTEMRFVRANAHLYLSSLSSERWEEKFSSVFLFLS